MSVESTQVKLRLTKEADVLAQLRKNRRLKADPKTGVESYVIQFNAQSFEFRPGSVITVGKSVANGLRRDSGVIMGEHLTGDIVPALEVVSEFQIGQEEPEVVSKTKCPACDFDNGSLVSLARHIEKVHKPGADEKRAARGVVDYEIEGEGNEAGVEEIAGEKSK